jgi:hypothetical protein
MLQVHLDLDNQILRYHLRNQYPINTQHLPPKITRVRVLIKVEMIDQHRHHRVIPGVTQIQTMTIQMMERMDEGERAAGRHAHLVNRLFPETHLLVLRP